jgi:hypothetical protein
MTPILDSDQNRRMYSWFMADAYRVFVVLDREYGERLSELARAGPVWIVDTPSNHEAVQRVWASGKHKSHLDGVTKFKTGDGCSSEDALINELDTIELHHGVYSADPPYTVIEVVGARVTERLRNELSQFGFTEFQATVEGFRAVRPLPRDGSSQ